MLPIPDDILKSFDAIAVAIQKHRSRCRCGINKYEMKHRLMRRMETTTLQEVLVARKNIS